MTFALMTTGEFSRNVGNSELKLVTDNLLSIDDAKVANCIAFFFSYVAEKCLC